MAQLKIDGHAHLVKDTKTGVITNKNKTEIALARKRKSLRLEKQKEEQKLHDKIDNLTDDLNRLQSMVRELIEKQL